jgi:hypothetical protein
MKTPPSRKLASGLAMGRMPASGYGYGGNRKKVPRLLEAFVTSGERGTRMGATGWALRKLHLKLKKGKKE